jgi:hypothetical protein
MRPAFAGRIVLKQERNWGAYAALASAPTVFKVVLES